MDRFSSAEDVEWARGPFREGSQARTDGYSLDHCPAAHHVGSFAAKSWRAGWADADQSIHADGLAEQMPVAR